MTLLTVDAKLMPILPLMLRPGVEVGADRRVRDGLGVPLRADRRASRPTPSSSSRRCPTMFGYFYPDADAGPREPERPGDRHRRPEPPGADRPRRYDIIVTDPPPPIESSGASVISSLEYYQAGHARLNPGGVMMQWMPYGSTLDEFKAHLRTFHAVFPHVLIAFGPGGYGFFMLGSDEPMTLRGRGDRRGPRAARRPRGHLVRLRLAGVDRRRAGGTGSSSLVWIADDEVTRVHGRRPADHGRSAAARVLPAPAAAWYALAASYAGELFRLTAR